MELLLGKYEITALLGDGSNGTVFKARHHELGFVRAIKKLKGYVESEDSDKYRSFLNEFRMLSYLGNCSHPNIVGVHNAALVNHEAYYEMDFIDGEPMSAYIDRVKFLTADEAIRCSRDILSAMAYAHVDVFRYRMNRETDRLEGVAGANPADEAKRRELIEKYGIIHNDLHSSNIIRNNYDGRYILLDFGISMTGGHAVRESGLGEGALAYMAPEKILKKEVTRRSDVYSIGILMYEALTGSVPFPAEDENGRKKSSAVMYGIHSEAPVPDIAEARAKAYREAGNDGEYERDFPEWLEKMIMKCLSKRKEDRYADAKEIFVEFEQHTGILLSDYNEQRRKAQLYEEKREAAERIERENLRNEALITRLKQRNRLMRMMVAKNVKRGFAWTLVVILAIAAAAIYQPLIMP